MLRKFDEWNINKNIRHKYDSMYKKIRDEYK